MGVSYEPGAACSILHMSFCLIPTATHLGAAGIPVLRMRELRLRGVPDIHLGTVRMGIGI